MPVRRFAGRLGSMLIGLVVALFVAFAHQQWQLPSGDHSVQSSPHTGKSQKYSPDSSANQPENVPPSSASPFPKAASQPSLSDSLNSDLQSQLTAADDGKMLQISGTLKKELPDDQDGSRHQKLLIQLASGQTVLLVHNLDLAPRVQPVYKGEAIASYGEYVWNDKGGLLHWTHHDPAGKHPAGWIRVGDRVFQ